MKNSRHFLEKFAVPSKIIPLFIAGLLMYLLMVLITIPKVKGFASGMDIPDMMPLGFSSQHIFQLMQDLGAEGRHFYLWRQIPLDMIYPFLFGLTCTLLLIFMSKKTFPQGHRLKIINYIPLFAALFDYLENLGVAIMLGRFPNFSPTLANITSGFTITKSMATMLFYLILIVYLFLIIKNRIKKKQT